MAAILGAALLGYFGTSPRSTDVVKVDEAAAHDELERPRFTRYELAERMHLRVDAPQARGSIHHPEAAGRVRRRPHGRRSWNGRLNGPRIAGNA